MGGEPRLRLHSREMTLPRRLAHALAALAALALSPSLEAQELTDRIVINGYTNFEFEKQISKEGNGDKNGSFDADQIDLVFNVTVSERVRVSIDLSWEHGTATELDQGNQALEYGFVEYALSDKLKLRFGKMHTPFGVFNEIHTAKPAFLSVKEAPSLNKNSRIVGGGYLFYPRWGSGIEAHGDAVVHGMDLTYDVLVANGDSETVNPFELDNNTSKSVTSRVRLDVTDNIRVGYSFYHDRLDSTSFTTIQSHGLEAEWSLARFRVLGEVAVGSLGLKSGGSQRQIGWYVQPSVHLSHGITPYLRYDSFNPNRDVADVDGHCFLVGVNIELAKNFQLKLENNDFRGGSKSTLAKYPGNGYNEIKAALVLGF